jgi:putative ABC transport system permease protein
LGDVTVAVGDARAVRAIAGHDDAGAAAALARGAAVVFWDGLVRDGRLRIHVDTADGSHGSDRELPAYVVRPLAGEPLAPALLPTATARAMGLRPVVHDYVVETSRTPTQAQVDRANADVGDLATAYVEHGYRPERWAYGLVALAIGAAIVTLGATAVTTGLSAAENRPDLATLAAVGAAPRTRRALAGSQAGTVTTLGAVLGVVAGVIPAWAILTANGGMPFVLPWPTIGALVVGLPVLTTLATAAASRASVAAERRPG